LARISRLVRSAAIQGRQPSRGGLLRLMNPRSLWRSEVRLTLRVAGIAERIQQARQSSFTPRAAAQASHWVSIGLPVSAVRCNSKPRAADGVRQVERLPWLRRARVRRAPKSDVSALRRAAVSGLERLTSRRSRLQAYPAEGNTEPSMLDTGLCSSRWAGSLVAGAPTSRFLMLPSLTTAETPPNSENQLESLIERSTPLIGDWGIRVQRRTWHRERRA
jgi:hypothetical protein